jgi:hypothetical protein
VTALGVVDGEVRELIGGRDLEPLTLIGFEAMQTFPR